MEERVENTGEKSGIETKWVSIRVPRSLLGILNRFRRTPREPWWFIIARIVSTFVENQREFDRRFWYQFKIINGWAYVKVALQMENEGRVDRAFVDAQIEKFAETLRETRKRIRSRGVDDVAAAILQLLEQVKQGANGKLIAEVNDRVKLLCWYIISAFEEKGEGNGGN